MPSRWVPKPSIQLDYAAQVSPRCTYRTSQQQPLDKDEQKEVEQRQYDARLGLPFGRRLGLACDRVHHRRHHLDLGLDLAPSLFGLAGPLRWHNEHHKKL